MNNNISGQKSLANVQAKFSVFMSQDNAKDLVNTAIGKDAQRFTASIISAVATNPALAECTNHTILSAALLGESLKLSPSPQLGHFYMVPFDATVKDANGNIVYLTDASGNKLTDSNGRWIKKTVKNAVFVLGYKGYIQLAIRSGYYKNINVLEVKDGEFISYNPFTEEFSARWYMDHNKRKEAKTVGYVALFEYLNGFRKLIYWTKEQMMIHVDTYSKAFSAEALKRLEAGEVPEKEMYKYSSFWYKDFDGMAKKTMLRQLISKWGIMSTELQTAFERDDMALDAQDKGGFISFEGEHTTMDDDTVVIPGGADIGFTDMAEDNVTDKEKEEFDFFGGGQ